MSSWPSRPTRRNPPPRARSPCSSTASRSAAAAWTTPCRSGSAATPAWTSAATTASSSTAATPTRRRSRLPARSARSSSTSLPTSTATTSMPSTSTPRRPTPPAGSVHDQGPTMSDNHKDVLIAAYLFEDLAERDFDAVLKLAEDDPITVEGVVLVQKDADGEVHVTQTGDHLGRKGMKLGGGIGLAVGLLAPPLLAATAVGAAAGGAMGKFVKHRLDSGIADKMDAALPPGSGGVIAVYDSSGAVAVDNALVNAVRKSVAQIDGSSAKDLKAGLAEAQAGMGG